MMRRMARLGRVTALAALMGACAATASWGEAPAPQPAMTTVMSSMSVRGAPEPGLAPGLSARPERRDHSKVVAMEMPDLRWDHVDGSDRWTQAAMRALATHGDPLVDMVPRDIAEWCPAYPEADDWTRQAFWAGLLSTLSKHESTYRPNAVGGGGLWYGLVQILPATARGYGCEADTGAELKDGALNMACAVRIMATTVPRDGVVARGMRGVAADWGPFHSRAKREDMRAWVAAQPFCNGLYASMRPVQRPDAPGEAETVPLFVAWAIEQRGAEDRKRATSPRLRAL